MRRRSGASGGGAAHLAYAQGQGQVQAQGGVVGERADEALELLDPVPQRVVVEVQPPRGLGHVAVGVEQHLEGVAQVGRLGGVGGELAEHVGDVAAQLAAVRDEGEQPVGAELVEGGPRPGSLQPAADPDGGAGLLVRPGQLTGVVGRPGDAERERQPSAAAVAGDLAVEVEPAGGPCPPGRRRRAARPPRC